MPIYKRCSRCGKRIPSDDEFYNSLQLYFGKVCILTFKNPPIFGIFLLYDKVCRNLVKLILPAYRFLLLSLQRSHMTCNGIKHTKYTSFISQSHLPFSCFTLQPHTIELYLSCRLAIFILHLYTVLINQNSDLSCIGCRKPDSEETHEETL